MVYGWSIKRTNIIPNDQDHCNKLQNSIICSIISFLFLLFPQNCSFCRLVTPHQVIAVLCQAGWAARAEQVYSLYKPSLQPVYATSPLVLISWWNTCGNAHLRPPHYTCSIAVGYLTPAHNKCRWPSQARSSVLVTIPSTVTIYPPPILLCPGVGWGNKCAYLQAGGQAGRTGWGCQDRVAATGESCSAQFSNINKTIWYGLGDFNLTVIKTSISSF